MRLLQAAACALLAGACAGATDTPATGTDRDQTPAANVRCDPDNGGLTLPDGFCAIVAHQGVGRARHLAVSEDGRVYVALSRPSGGGAIVALRDTDGDARLDAEQRFGETGGTGIATHGDWLYFAPNTAVHRYRLGPDLAPATAAEEVVTGFPGQRSHAAKSIAFDSAGNLYVNVGGPSNACQVQDRQHGSPGQDPCPELERQTGIWRFRPAGTPLRQQDGARFATGIRNAVAIAWSPAADALFVVQHGRDMLNVIAPEHFDEQANAELPAEELLRVDEGDDFGHPYCYYDPDQRRRVLAPEYGGDGRTVGRCDAFEEPVATYPAHFAPNDLLFYTAGHFPERYRGGAFIAFHGSWNRAPEPQAGYQVVFQPMSGGAAAGEWEVFADGFAGPGTIREPGDADHRPMGLAVAPDGSLYVVDSVAGRIWRVFWRG
jgi:glucose/arabinose dehydrogenase